MWVSIALGPEAGFMAPVGSVTGGRMAYQIVPQNRTLPLRNFPFAQSVSPSDYLLHYFYSNMLCSLVLSSSLTTFSLFLPSNPISQLPPSLFLSFILCGKVNMIGQRTRN